MSKKTDLLQNRPRRGNVVLFVARNGKIRLGEILDDPAAGQDEFFVQDAGGARSRIKWRDLLLNLGPATDGLMAVQQQVEKMAEEIDIELLLESHPEWHHGPATLISAISEEYFGKEANAQQQAAMYLALQRDSRFTVTGEKMLYRPPAPVRRRRSEQQRQQERQALFTAICETMTESLQKSWGAPELSAHPQGKRLVRLVRATLEQRRLYPEAWRKEFILHLHSLHSLTGYRDARHLIFHWLKKMGRVPPEADLFIFSEPLLRRQSQRLADYQNATLSEQSATDPASAVPAATEANISIIGKPEQPEWVVAIDNPETTDRDDALSFRRTEAGIEIGVHTPLLEVWVPAGTLFDQRAYDVGASAYLPHRTVPMLPPEISNERASLNAGCERDVLSFYFTASQDKPVRLSRVVCERINIGFNTDYEQVDAWLGEFARDHGENGGQSFSEPDAGNEEHPSRNLVEALQVWSTEARRLEKQRLANGARTFDRDEVDVRVGADGIVRLRRIPRDSAAHKMVAEWMIAANQAAAQFCHENQLPCIYRVQENLMPEREDVEPSSAQGHVRAQLRPERGPHRDLGVDGYTQITSPLRRYSDLVTQRQIVSFLQTGKPCYSQTDLWARAFAIEEATRRIQRLESRADFYWKCVYLSQHLGETYTARICKTKGFPARVFLQILDLDLRLFVPPSGIEGIAERKIPPHHSPKEVEAVCLEMEAEKGEMRFQIR